MAKNRLKRKENLTRNLQRPKDFSSIVYDPVRIDNESINCVFLHPEFGPIPYTASLNDPEQYGREIYKYLSGELCRQN